MGTGRNTSSLSFKEVFMKRTKNTGTLIKTKTGLYIAKWMFNRKVYTRSTQCYEEDKALDKLAEFTRPFQESNSIAVFENIQAKINTIEKTAHKERILISSIMEKYSTNINVNINKSTMDLRRRIFGFFLKWLKLNHKEITYIDQLQKELVEEYLEYINNRQCSVTYNNSLSVLKLLFNFFNCPVFNSFKNRKVREKEIRIFTKEEIDKILKACRTLDDKILFYTAIYCGLRKSDICSLKWENIDFTNNVITKRSLKTNVQFIVPIHPSLLNVYKEALKHKTSDYVSPRLNRIYYSNDATEKVIRRIYKRSGINLDKLKNGLHIFRHNFISKCINGGIDLYTVMKFVGHTQVKTLLRYCHLTDIEKTKQQLINIF